VIEVGNTGRVRLKGLELEQMRWNCYVRDEGRCVVCQRRLRFERGGFNSMHMAHVEGRGAGGSDTLENVQTKCFDCHIVLEHNPKSVPSKGKRR